MKLKLSLLVAVLGLSTSVAWSDEPTIKITSFIQSAPQSRIAELCGKVTGAAPASLGLIEVVVDPRGNNPAEYSVPMGKTGNFCVVVHTYHGQAQAAYWLPGHGQLRSAIAQLSGSDSR